MVKSGDLSGIYHVGVAVDNRPHLIKEKKSDPTYVSTQGEYRQSDSGVTQPFCKPGWRKRFGWRKIDKSKRRRERIKRKGHLAALCLRRWIAKHKPNWLSRAAQSDFARNEVLIEDVEFVETYVSEED
jgi:hypothetical protein